MEYDCPNTALMAPGQTSVMTVTITNSSVITTAAHAPAVPPGTRYGRSAPGYLRRRIVSAGKMKM